MKTVRREHFREEITCIKDKEPRNFNMEKQLRFILIITLKHLNLSISFPLPPFILTFLHLSFYSFLTTNTTFTKLHFQSYSLTCALKLIQVHKHNINLLFLSIFLNQLLLYKYLISTSPPPAPKVYFYPPHTFK